MTGNSTQPPRVIRVREGTRGASGDRIFCVTLNRAVRDDELGVVAEARDPKTGTRIPTAGEPHPADSALTARAPLIYPVGLRDAAGGAMLADRSCFYNVRVRYGKAVTRDQ